MRPIPPLMFKSPKRFDFIKNFVEIFSAKLVDKVFFLPEKALVWAWGGDDDLSIYQNRPEECQFYSFYPTSTTVRASGCQQSLQGVRCGVKRGKRSTDRAAIGWFGLGRSDFLRSQVIRTRSCRVRLPKVIQQERTGLRGASAPSPRWRGEGDEHAFEYNNFNTLLH